MKTTSAVQQQGASAEKITSDLDHRAVQEIAGELRRLLADTFALYFKKNPLHWHMKGRHFRDHHLLLDEQVSQLFGITDEIAERARKIRATALRSIGDITRHQRLQDSDREHITTEEMLGELRTDNQKLPSFIRMTHPICDRYRDVATASSIEVWIDQAERRTWYLSEVGANLS